MYESLADRISRTIFAFLIITGSETVSPMLYTIKTSELRKMNCLKWIKSAVQTYRAKPSLIYSKR